MNKHHTSNDVGALECNTKPSSQLHKPRVVIIGCGDVGERLIPLLIPHFRVFAVTSQASSSNRFAQLRRLGAVPIQANLDDANSLWRLRQLSSRFVHLAPPATFGEIDARTRRLAAILPEKAQLVYISTTGVYGDCAGASFDEARTVAPSNARAKRRVDAEKTLRTWAKRGARNLSILRVPGIYAEDRLPIERLQKGTPALIDAEDVYTNHIHADDLAYVIKLALFRAMPSRVYHIVDDSALKMGEYFDLVAKAYNLPPAPRLPRTELEKQVSPMLLSFMSESRRLQNQRLKLELGARLTYPEVSVALEKFRALAR
ncbi:SDR family NAD(P)-dependent oxidoreductase [Undibacterium cyanobacteriorum]|uniref:SDR family NAD(P)-dependent oxidoreductase n=1 Tax=Undibacterium cyanobacteriorum TaxID=3073561 RepID=A0ABY9RME1_9BURK|nr:SDR family NAD(P)-dependent oxidoreductase [Undibacterium sp. 20NA77.5]WMW82370.1 SDR family NAD(P)-dependent oxidoreductase [Undibacterium sp. 20NA77.5]